MSDEGQELQARAIEEASDSFNPARFVGEYMGRAYMDVAHRLLWLDHEHPRYTITTEILHYGEDYAVVKATVTILSPADGLMERCVSAHGQARRSDMPKHISARFLEKAETAAVGRALGMLGLGTLHAQDFDDTEHLADSPVERPTSITRVPQGAGPATRPPDDDDVLGCQVCGNELELIKFKDGTHWTPQKLADYGRRKHGAVLCMDHYREFNEAKRGGRGEEQ